MGDVPQPSTTCTLSFIGLLNCAAGDALDNANADAHALVATIAVSFVSLGVQLLAFALLRLRLTRIYRPRSYLVPERERTAAPPGGLVGWLIPLFTTPNLTIIRKCGLDAYFFLRYLRMLLKLFFPLTLLFLPVLMPINATAGGEARGLDRLSISNIGPKHLFSRMWAHLVLAVVAIFWILYVVYKEMRGYVRVRQAFLTSPEHRIRASATTVLVTGIPRKWLTLDGLSGLYDVFPGGVKNIWINRNYDELAAKVSTRESVAKSLEDAETNLIKACRKKHAEAQKKRGKEQKQPKRSKAERRQDVVDEDAAAEKMAQSEGTSAGEQRDVPQAVQDILEEEDQQQEDYDRRAKNPFGVMTDSLGVVGKGFTKLSGRVVGGLDNGLHKAGNDLNRVTETANAGGLAGGFAADESLYGRSGSPPTTPSKYGPNHVVDVQTRPMSMGKTEFGAFVTTKEGQGSPASERTLGVADSQITRPSNESRPKSPMQIEEPPAYKRSNLWRVFGNNDASLAFPSPQPHFADEDEFPLRAPKVPEQPASTRKVLEKLAFWRPHDEEPKEEYPTAVNVECDADQDEEPAWRRYMDEKDRETMRLPIVGATWFPSLPLVGEKVDKIYYLRRELARLNLEIEADQNDPEKYPLMNSAFIQFNHQVAAHMCCQSLNHHVPSQMAPRLVEISPNDVIWDNMSMKWWERYVRTMVVLAICVGLVILYAIPVAFTSLLNTITRLAALVPWLRWLLKLPTWVQGIIEGVLPPVLLALILLLVPIIFRLLVKQQGVPTGNSKEQGVQIWYFTFLFIQVFLVVTLSKGILSFIGSASNPGEIATTISTNFPMAADYFFSYLTVQALSQGASALLQTGTLFSWFILGPLLDSTARAKWQRQIQLNGIDWGTFYPPFTNFAVIGIIYSVLAPLMLVFMLLIFGIFWIVYRYNVLYVFQFKNDTGGLLFPVAVHQLFVGLYFMEICLIGTFFSRTNNNDDVVCIPQGVIMIVMLAMTALYQWRLSVEFTPLQEYLPITLEDDAVVRDEAFAKAQAAKFAPLREDMDTAERSEGAPAIEQTLERREKEDDTVDEALEEAERRDFEMRRRSRSQTPGLKSGTSGTPSDGLQAPLSPAKQAAWYQHVASKPAWATDGWKKAAPEAVARLRYLADGKPVQPKTTGKRDVEAQHTVGDVLFSGFADELEDLSPDDRDLLVRYAFQHSALRARRPVVWIPRDKLGVSDDEIKRAERMSTVRVDLDGKGEVEKTLIWMSNEGTALDSKGRVVFRRSPPDISNVDLIAL